MSPHGTGDDDDQKERGDDTGDAVQDDHGHGRRRRRAKDAVVGGRASRRRGSRGAGRTQQGGVVRVHDDLSLRRRRSPQPTLETGSRARREDGIELRSRKRFIGRGVVSTVVGLGVVEDNGVRFTDCDFRYDLGYGERTSVGRVPTAGVNDVRPRRLTQDGYSVTLDQDQSAGDVGLLQGW